MSGSVNLEIVKGADWATQIQWNDGFGNGVGFSNPIMEVRKDLNPNSPRILRLDTSGSADGLIEITGPGTMFLSLSAAKTASVPAGSAFWDLFLVTGNSQVARLLFGNVAIKPNVTVIS